MPPLEGGLTGVLAGGFGLGVDGAVGGAGAGGFVNGGRAGGGVGGGFGLPGEFRGAGGCLLAVVGLDTGAALRLSGTLPPGGGPPMTGRRRLGASGSFFGARMRFPPLAPPISEAKGSPAGFPGGPGAAVFSGGVGRPGEFSGSGAFLPATVGLDTGAAWRLSGTLPPGGGPPMTGRLRLGASAWSPSGFARPFSRVRPCELPMSASKGSPGGAPGADGLGALGVGVASGASGVLT